MAFGKSEEEKTAERERKAEEAIAREKERQEIREEYEAKELARKRQEDHEKWLRTPVGMATKAKENGEGFFEIELEVGRSKRDVVFGSKDFGGHQKKTFTGLLSEIEAAGWKLEHVGYYFMITGETSRDKLLASGQNTAVSGNTMGVYLFRNLDN